MSTGAFLEFLTRLGCRDAGLGLVGQVSTHKNSAGSRPQGPVGQVSRGLGARAPRAWGPAHQGPFPHKNHPNLSNYDFSLVGAWRRRGCRLKRLLRRWGPGGKRSRDTPPTPPPPHPPPPAFFGAVREKGRGFSPSPPSATIQHAPQGRRIQEVSQGFRKKLEQLSHRAYRGRECPVFYKVFLEFCVILAWNCLGPQTPCPSNHHVKAKPTPALLMLLIERNV